MTTLNENVPAVSVHQLTCSISPSIKDQKLHQAPRFMSPTALSVSKQTQKTAMTGKEKWTTSAVKRISLRRITNGTPISRKEALKQQPRSIAFPEKFGETPSPDKLVLHDKKKGSPFSTASSDLNKPLPTPPVAQVETSGVSGNSRCILDASERPLKRSPPGKPEEDWPALSPKRPAASQIVVEGCKTPEQDVVVQPESYPKLPSASYSVPPDAGHKEIEKPSVQHNQRKKVSSANLNEAHLSADQGGQHSASTSDLNNKGTVSRAPVSKYSKMHIEEPRQTRTSSLRAELAAVSAGNKVQEHGKAVSTAANWAYKQPLIKSSRSSIHPPANFVAGRRRPAPKRPDSRGSSRGSNRGSNRGIEQSFRPAPSASGDRGNEGAFNLAITANGRRQSSIPIYRAQTSQGARTARDGKTTSDSTDSTLSVFEDAVSTLGTIQGSPNLEYQTKRLSMTSPNYGPVLRISRSAEDIIMGTGSDKENVVPGGKEKIAGGGHTLVAINHTHPSSTKHLERSLKARDSKVRSMDAEPIFSSSSRDRVSSRSVSFVKAGPLDDPFVDQPTTVKTEDAAADVGPNPFRSVQDEQNAEISAATTSAGIYEEGESGFLSDKEWISPVARKADTMSMGRVKPMLEDYSPPVDPKQRDSFNGVSAKPETSDSGDGSKLSTLSKPSNVSKPSALLVPSESSTLATNKGTPITPQTDVTGTAGSNKFPPRSSSRTVPSTFGSLNPQHPELISPTQLAGYSHHSVENNEDIDHSTRRGDPVNIQVKSRPFGRDSTALESTQSHGSISKKGVMSNIRGLFHKHSATEAEAALITRSTKRGKKASSKSTSTALPPISNIHPAHRHTASSSIRARGRSPFPSLTQFSSPPLKSPFPTHVSSSTTLAMQILESARNERSSPKKEKLLELGKIMVDAITQARDAERAMEEARHATRKAEFAHAQCTKSVGDVARCVMNLRNELVTNR